MGALSMSTRVPPYSGVPRLSHQFPVAVVVAVEVTAAEVVDEGITIVEVVEVDDGVEITVVVVDVVVVEVGVVVDEVQDAKTMDAVRRKVSDARISPLFIQTSFANKLVTCYFYKNNTYKYLNCANTTIKISGLSIPYFIYNII
jgi:hypothetical protein